MISLSIPEEFGGKGYASLFWVDLNNYTRSNQADNRSSRSPSVVDVWQIKS